MNKEELEKEAEEYALANRSMCVEGDNADLLKEVFLDVAEPREKQLQEKDKKIAELEAQIEKMKSELHHRLVSPSHDDSDCLDKIIGLDRLWQFGQEF